MYNKNVKTIELSKQTKRQNSFACLFENLRWEFIKENKKVRKQELDQESDQEKKKVFFRMIEPKNNNFHFEPVQHLKMFNTWTLLNLQVFKVFQVF